MTAPSLIKQSELNKMAETANAKRVIVEMIIGDRTIRVRPDTMLDGIEGEDEVERAIAAFEAKHGRG